MCCQYIRTRLNTCPDQKPSSPCHFAGDTWRSTNRWTQTVSIYMDSAHLLKWRRRICGWQVAILARRMDGRINGVGIKCSLGLWYRRVQTGIIIEQYNNVCIILPCLLVPLTCMSRLCYVVHKEQNNRQLLISFGESDCAFEHDTYFK